MPQGSYTSILASLFPNATNSKNATTKGSSAPKRPSNEQPDQERELRSLREEVKSLKKINDRRRRLFESKEVMSKDLKAEVRREKHAHDETKSRNQELQEKLHEACDREAELKWRVEDLEQSVDSLAPSAAESPSTPSAVEDLESRLHQAELKNRVLGLALRTSFKLLPSLENQTSLQQICAWSGRQIRAKVGDGAAAIDAMALPDLTEIVDEDYRPKIANGPQLTFPIRKKRKFNEDADCDEVQGSNNFSASGALLSPPPSARKKQPGRAVKSQSPGFYTERAPNLVL